MIKPMISARSPGKALSRSMPTAFLIVSRGTFYSS